MMRAGTVIEHEHAPGNVNEIARALSYRRWRRRSRSKQCQEHAMVDGRW